MTVEQNVLLPLDMFTNWTKAEKMARVQEVLDRVGLENATHIFPPKSPEVWPSAWELPASLCNTLATCSATNPTPASTPGTTGRIDELILEFTREYKITTVISTHDMNSVMEIGEADFYLDKGEKHWEGIKDDIMGSDDAALYKFIFASDFLQDAKAALIKQVGRDAVRREASVF